MQWNKLFSKKESGSYWETVAKDYLVAKGLQVVEQNFHSRFGEVDLIMQEKQTLVFVEVKFRKNKQFGGAISAISASKQKKIMKTAAIYLQQKQLNEYNTDYRFDVIAIEGDAPQGDSRQINWLKNAFSGA